MTQISHIEGICAISSCATGFLAPYIATKIVTLISKRGLSGSSTLTAYIYLFTIITWTFIVFGSLASIGNGLALYIAFPYAIGFGLARWVQG